MKRKFKNKYVTEPETAKIVTNIATLYYLMRNYHESSKYYQHALEILYRVPI